MTLDEIREQLTHLDQLADGDRDQLELELQAAMADARTQPVSPETVALMGEIADGLDQVRGQTPVAASGDFRTQPPAPPQQAEPSARPQPVRLGAVARRQPRQDPPPREGHSAGGVLTAAGQPLSDTDALVRQFIEHLLRVNQDGFRGRAVVASARWADSYPEDRTLTDSLADNVAKIAAVTSPRAITAAGGVCRPVQPRWQVDVLPVSDRPLRDALPSFQATRGGVRYLAPPRLSDANVAGSVGVWTAATDTNPGANTKALGAFTCPGEVEQLVDAVTTRLGFGNMQARFSPEPLAALMTVLTAQAARVAETKLLNAMFAASVAATAPAYVGAARDLLATMDLAATAYRSRHRMSEDAPMRVVLPTWAESMIRTDLARQLPGDNALAVTDAQITDAFAVRNLLPAWTPDLDPFGAQAPGAAVTAWPTTVRWLLYAEGTFLFLDGGQLDLGVVRDSTLNATNRAEMFSETFEQVAFVGTESIAVTSTVHPSGATAGTVVPA